MQILTFIIVLFCLTHNWEFLEAKYVGSPKEALRVAEQKSVDVCLTPECKTAASEILHYMDPKVAPCDDFYNFACGNFLKTTVVPKDQTVFDKFYLLNKKIDQQLRTILEESIQPNEPKFSRLAKNYYKACMNTAAIEKNGLQPILDDLKTLGGWPVLQKNSWKDEGFDWKKTTYILNKMGYQADYLFAFGYECRTHKDVCNLIIDQPCIRLEPEDLVKGFSDKLVKVYYNYMVDIAVMLGANRLTAENEMKESLEFEIKLAKVKKYPSIPWKEYFNTMLKGITEIGEEEVIAVSAPSFFKEFEKLINQTSKKILANYLLRKTVDEAIPYLSDKIRNRQLQFTVLLYGEYKRQPRWQDCVDDTSGFLDISVSALYARQSLRKDSKQSAADLVAAIKKEFTNIVKQTNWMNEKTRKSVLGKIDAMITYIGGSNELLDNKKVDELYYNLEITPNDYLRADLNVSRSMFVYFMKDMRKESVETTKWLYRHDSFYAYTLYYPADNSIQVPAGALQDIFFNKNRPMYMNFAAIGWLIAHEITNSFNNDQYDKKTECIVQQYEKYTVKEFGLSVNATKTKPDNIAYIEGLKATYSAYQGWVKQHGVEPKLPELQHYSQSQIFWIAAAQTFCTKYTKKGLKEIADFGQSPTEFRVQGAFSNRPEFAKDFNCPVGSNMNPVEKCTLW